MSEDIPLSSPLLHLTVFSPELENVAPEEETDMDLVADRLVLLSLPAKEKDLTELKFTAETLWEMNSAL